MRWRVESLAGDPAYCASVVRDYPNVTLAVTHLENWITRAITEAGIFETVDPLFHCFPHRKRGGNRRFHLAG
jgi:hypothetical protein